MRGAAKRTVSNTPSSRGQAAMSSNSPHAVAGSASFVR